MFTINAWQCFLEIILTVFTLMGLRGFALIFGPDHSPTKESSVFSVAWGISGFTILNSFYLLGERKFRRNLDTHGIVKALRRALLQDYN